MPRLPFRIPLSATPSPAPFKSLLFKGLPVVSLILVATQACAPAPSEQSSSGVAEPAATTSAAETGEGSTAEGDSWTVAPSPELPQDRPLVAGFVVTDGVYNTELAGPWDILQHSVYQIQPGIVTVAISPDGEPITTAEGLRLIPDHGFADAPALDILVVPSAEESRGADRENDALVGFIAERGQQARYVMSLCWGAFLLAEAGLLDDRAATTFPPDQPGLADAFPRVDVRQGMSFVHDGPALTSQGGVESYTAAMYLLDHLYGPEVAAGVGGGLLIPWPPESGSVEAVVLTPEARDAAD
ncbi:MAG: DJ-1/PfpI family protein [Acidobacteriota bacterium]